MTAFYEKVERAVRNDHESSPQLPPVSHLKFDIDQQTLTRVSLITKDSLSCKDSKIMSKIETKWLPVGHFGFYIR